MFHNINIFDAQHIIEYRKGVVRLNNSNICVLGKDNRMDYIAQGLYDLGYDVYRDEVNINKDSVIILPPPVGDSELKQIFPRLFERNIVYGGAVSNRFRHECELNNINVYDYLKWNEVTERNAEITARGAIKEAYTIRQLKNSSNCLVTGYGFCGKAISKELKGLTKNISIMVRRKELKQEIEKMGYKYSSIKDIYLDARNYDYIFNTIPALVLDEDVINTLTPKTIIIDIASAPGGTDFECCRRRDITARLSLGIPGKMYPKEAGKIILDAVLNHMNSI